MDQHAVVQHAPNYSGRPDLLRGFVGGSWEGTGVCGDSTAGFPAVRPPDAGGAGDRGADLWLLHRLLDGHALCRRPAAQHCRSTLGGTRFSRPLPFYLFDLPFYSEVLEFVFVLAVLCALVFWATALGWKLWARGTSARTFEEGPRLLLLHGASRASFVRILSAILLLGFAALVFLGNYDLTNHNSHAFMTGADYVDAKVTLPLRWLLIVAIFAALPLAWTARYLKAAILVASFFILQLVLPSIIGAVYVRPNEISIERPYIERHIQATSVAFGLDRKATERPFAASAQQTVDPVQDATLLDNVRLWDLRAYNATITQIQALRPYYTFPNTDVDRYFIDGRIKQVLVSPRELDVSQLSAAANQSWINPRFIYTHGIGVVVSEVNKITPDGPARPAR